nr:MAG TPA: hypothetical protein [Caudoviricetes sp.]
MMKVVAGYEVVLDDETGLIKGVWVGTNYCSVYKRAGKYGGWNNALPCTISAFKSGIYRGTYVVM